MAANNNDYGEKAREMVPVQCQLLYIMDSPATSNLFDNPAKVLRRNPSGNRVILILVGQKSSTRII